MNTLNDISSIPASEFNMANLLDLRYDEVRGIVKIWQIRGRLIIEENFQRRFL
jgi:hypothetical protein